MNTIIPFGILTYTILKGRYATLKGTSFALYSTNAKWHWTTKSRQAITKVKLSGCLSL